MKNENGNLPAYPTRVAEPAADDPSVIEIVIRPGLTKREAFAMAAMQGILSSSADRGEKAVADMSIKFADELLKQLES